MDAAKKLELLDWVMHLKNESVLQKLWTVKEEVEEYPENEIVGYTVLGEPMNMQQYHAKLERGEKDIEEGRYTSHEDLKNEMESW